MTENGGLRIVPINSEDKQDDEDKVLDKDDCLLRKAYVEGDPSTTFFALVNFFDAASTKHLRPENASKDIFPNEIYTHILTFVTDIATRGVCKQVSRTFHQLFPGRQLY